MGYNDVIGNSGLVLALLGWVYQIGGAMKEQRMLKERQSEIEVKLSRNLEKIYDKLDNMQVKCPQCPGVRLEK